VAPRLPKKSPDPLRKGSLLREARRVGLGAVRRRDRTHFDDSAGVVETSIDVDAALERIDPNAARWDYFLDVRASEATLVGVEVHPAVPREVKKVIEKKRWAETVVAENFREGSRVHVWYWIASGTMGLSKNTREYRQLAQSGIKIAGRLRLPGDLGE